MESATQYLNQGNRQGSNCYGKIMKLEKNEIISKILATVIAAAVLAFFSVAYETVHLSRDAVTMSSEALKANEKLIAKLDGFTDRLIRAEMNIEQLNDVQLEITKTVRKTTELLLVVQSQSQDKSK